MDIQTYFSESEASAPDQVSLLRRISLALRRSGLKTMEELCRIQAESPEQLMEIRDIGQKSLPLIENICMKYQEEYSDGWLEVNFQPPVFLCRF